MGHNTVWFDRYAGTNVLEKPAGSIFRADDGGSRLLQNTGMYLSCCRERRVTFQRIAILKRRSPKNL